MNFDDIPVFDEPGYVMIYLSYEGTNNWVDFDDFKVEHIESAVVQTDNYYPFGLTFNSYQRFDAKANKFKYSGFESLDDFGFDLYDYQARYYDPVIGRFIQVDPATDVMSSWGAYTYAFNNPILFIDPDGMMPEDSNIFWGFGDQGSSNEKATKETTARVDVNKVAEQTDSNGEVTGYSVDFTLFVDEEYDQFDDNGNYVTTSRRTTMSDETLHFDAGGNFKESEEAQIGEGFTINLKGGNFAIAFENSIFDGGPHSYYETTTRPVLLDRHIFFELLESQKPSLLSRYLSHVNREMHRLHAADQGSNPLKYMTTPAGDNRVYDILKRKHFVDSAINARRRQRGDTAPIEGSRLIPAHKLPRKR
ncbi:MAG: RHS repeat-associated core domain-containing protein [Cyclobacteriaceae bacterium]